MDVPINYHVWGTMLGHYQRHMPKLANVRPRKKTVLLMIQNDLLHEFTDKAIVSFCNRLWLCVAATGGALTLRTVCLNTEWAMGIWHSRLKHLNCWWKAVKNWFVIRAYYMCNCIFTWRKWTLKFKLLYPRNYISVINDKNCSNNILIFNGSHITMSVTKAEISPHFYKSMVMSRPVDVWDQQLMTNLINDCHCAVFKEMK